MISSDSEFDGADSDLLEALIGLHATGMGSIVSCVPYAAPTSQAASLNVFTNVTPFSREVRVAYDNFRVSSGSMTC